MRRLATFLLVLAAGADGGFTGQPRIADMLITGQAGPSRSTVSRSILLVGKYLYVSGEPGMQAVSAVNPEDLRLTSDWPYSSAKMNGAAYKGNVLYVTNWHPAEGLVLFDITNPARPAHLKTLATPNYSWDAVVTGDLLDVSVGNETKSGIVTYDIKDPRNPRPLNTLEIDRRLIGNATRYGGYLYFTQDHDLHVYEASDPARPRFARKLSFGVLSGQTRVYRGHLYVVSAGIRVFSLEDPGNPRQTTYTEEEGLRGMHFQGNFLFIPASGTRVITLVVSDPARPRPVSSWDVAWPSFGHPGYPISVTGAGDYLYVAATGTNNRDCEDFTCPCYGARVYSVQVAGSPPSSPQPPIPHVECRGQGGAGPILSVSRRPSDRTPAAPPAAQSPGPGAQPPARPAPAADRADEAVQAAAEEDPDAVRFACKASPYAASLFPKACGAAEDSSEDHVSHAPRGRRTGRGR